MGICRCFTTTEETETRLGIGGEHGPSLGALGRVLHELSQFVEKRRQPESSSKEMASPCHFRWTGGVAAWHSDRQPVTLAPQEECLHMSYIPSLLDSAATHCLGASIPHTKGVPHTL